MAVDCCSSLIAAQLDRPNARAGHDLLAARRVIVGFREVTPA
jgi:hypothetical protein